MADDDIPDHMKTGITEVDTGGAESVTITDEDTGESETFTEDTEFDEPTDVTGDDDDDGGGSESIPEEERGAEELPGDQDVTDFNPDTAEGEVTSSSGGDSQKPEEDMTLKEKAKNIQKEAPSTSAASAMLATQEQIPRDRAIELVEGTAPPGSLEETKKLKRGVESGKYSGVRLGDETLEGEEAVKALEERASEMRERADKRSDLAFTRNLYDIKTQKLRAAAEDKKEGVTQAVGARIDATKDAADEVTPTGEILGEVGGQASKAAKEFASGDFEEGFEQTGLLGVKLMGAGQQLSERYVGPAAEKASKKFGQIPEGAEASLIGLSPTAYAAEQTAEFGGKAEKQVESSAEGIAVGAGTLGTQVSGLYIGGVGAAGDITYEASKGLTAAEKKSLKKGVTEEFPRKVKEDMLTPGGAGQEIGEEFGEAAAFGVLFGGVGVAAGAAPNFELDITPDTNIEVTDVAVRSKPSARTAAGQEITMEGQQASVMTGEGSVNMQQQPGLESEVTVKKEGWIRSSERTKTYEGNVQTVAEAERTEGGTEAEGISKVELQEKDMTTRFLNPQSGISEPTQDSGMAAKQDVELGEERTTLIDWTSEAESEEVSAQSFKAGDEGSETSVVEFERRTKTEVDTGDRVSEVFTREEGRRVSDESGLAEQSKAVTGETDAGTGVKSKTTAVSKGKMDEMSVDISKELDTTTKDLSDLSESEVEGIVETGKELFGDSTPESEPSSGEPEPSDVAGQELEPEGESELTGSDITGESEAAFGEASARAAEADVESEVGLDVGPEVGLSVEPDIGMEQDKRTEPGEVLDRAEGLDLEPGLEVEPQQRQDPDTSLDPTLDIGLEPEGEFGPEPTPQPGNEPDPTVPLRPDIDMQGEEPDFGGGGEGFVTARRETDYSPNIAGLFSGETLEEAPDENRVYSGWNVRPPVEEEESDTKQLDREDFVGI